MSAELVAAVVGAAGSVLSAYIAAKVRGVATTLNGQTAQLRRDVEGLRRQISREREYHAATSTTNT